MKHDKIAQLRSPGIWRLFGCRRSMMASEGRRSSSSPEGETLDRFPAGLRVLVIDDDRTSLKLLEHMLRKCLYDVTVCSESRKALSLLRGSKDRFDIVISDVHMPDMDGFKLLELIGLEMDLPIIMMSGDGRSSTVMRGIIHGACEYLIKPVRMQELKTIWQHAVRKNLNIDRRQYVKPQRKRPSETAADEDQLNNDEPSASKKPRVVWSFHLHQKFCTAVNQLGIDST
ncbi:hypothetical protein ZOSMA_28G00760 [Zostera marina]|uniref:Response regulatory domain-containing protein n=1 Tax=Zostera marina TaxID=29655 RepID=A0A0K9PCN4_ZOSMR|nr:hypothetical protein ZOSMA_28G00760 [Zostera marina]